MKSDLLKFGIIGLAAVLLQLLIFRHLGYHFMEPDFTLVILVWCIATQSRTHSLLFAAYLGFLNDFFLDLWGLHLMAKTATTLLLYTFVPRINEARLFFTQAFLLLFVISLIHNFILLMAAWFTDNYTMENIILPVLIGGSLLTSVLGSAVYMLRES